MLIRHYHFIWCFSILESPVLLIFLAYFFIIVNPFKSIFKNTFNIFSMLVLCFMCHKHLFPIFDLSLNFYMWFLTWIQSSFSIVHFFRECILLTGGVYRLVVTLLSYN